ncbi:MAG: ABC transporter permease [Actinobacteria bacterium]|nr:MAG: ABC transporter permease [Actinomycetota bacterium]
MVVVGEWRDIARRFARNRLAVACSIVLVVMYAIMLLSYVWVGGKPITMPQDPYEYNLLRAMAPPSASHIIGTDRIGHDALSQVIEGSKISLNIGLASMAAAILLGVAVGGLAGYYGGWLDGLLMRLTDLFLSFPQLPLLLVLAVLFSPGFWMLVLFISLFSWMNVARLVRAQFLSLREKEFVLAARAIGASDWRIMTAHLLRNSWAPVIVAGTLGIANAILTEAWLSFLGFGVPPSVPSWGNLLTDAGDYMFTAPLLVIVPGTAITLTVLCFNFLGDGLRDALDPYLKD